MFIKTLNALTFVACMAVTGGAMLMSTADPAFACGGPCPEPEPEPEPKPEPPKPEPKPVDDKDLVCPRGDEATVKRSVGALSEGDMVTRVAGQIISRGGNWTVVKVLPARTVCVAKVRKATIKVVPAGETRQCDEKAAAKAHLVCQDLYVGGKAD
ncbi:MAG: hypothetical protein V4606_02405 [Patescibacteria group bacterium]